MKRATYRVLQFGIVIGVGTAVLSMNERAPFSSSVSLMSSAHAVIGRPLTPMSYAGVARRTTRRSVAVGAAVAAPVVVGPVPACVQAVDVYGRIYTRCR